MGSLHEGHLSLIRLARERSDFVVVSLFVNPTQFGPGEDLETYPRDLAGDREKAAGAGADLLFRPSAEEMYPEGSRTKVHVEKISEPLCGRDRPGHFDGVALVVAKLLNIVRPDVSVFGQKDAQQAVLIRRLAADLNLPGEIVVAPTVREPDGLAMSSRNRYLSAEERAAALALSGGLFDAAAAWEGGERDGDALAGLARRRIEREPLLAIDYVELVALDDLGPWPGGDAPGLLAGAVRVGKARLIDNVILGEAPSLASGAAGTPASSAAAAPATRKGTG
jgi:pantoate--beta-alanine ligase